MLILDGVMFLYCVVNGVKVFYLVVEEVEYEFVLGLCVMIWGYNG